MKLSNCTMKAGQCRSRESGWTAGVSPDNRKMKQLIRKKMHIAFNNNDEKYSAEG
jgi:hypothetical protein